MAVENPEQARSQSAKRLGDSVGPTACRSCGHSSSTPIAVFCESCGKPLAPISWVHLTFLTASIAAVGFYLGMTEDDRIPVVFGLFLLAIYVSLLLRNYASNLVRFLPLYVLASLIVYFREVGGVGPVDDTVLWIGCVIAVIYLSVTVFIAWHKACVKSGTHHVTGLPVLSLTAYLLALGLPKLSHYLPAAPAMSWIQETIARVAAVTIFGITLADLQTLRLTLLIFTAAYIGLTALLRTVRKGIPRQSPWIPPFPGFGASAVSAVPTSGQPRRGVFSRVLIACAEGCYIVARSVANAVYWFVSISARLTVNYAAKIIEVAGAEFRLALRTYLRWVLDYLLELVVSVVMAYSLVRLLLLGDHYALGSQFRLGIIFYGCVLLFAIVVLIWETARESLSTTLEAILKSNLVALLVILVCMLISSWLLWAISHVKPELPFGNVGPFTLWASVVVGVLTAIAGVHSFYAKQSQPGAGV